MNFVGVDRAGLKKFALSKSRWGGAFLCIGRNGMREFMIKHAEGLSIYLQCAEGFLPASMGARAMCLAAVVGLTLSLALVMASQDGKLGPRLSEAKKGSCTQRDPTKPSPEPGRPPERFCGQKMISSRRLTAVSVPITELIPMLSRLLGRTILDRTGLNRSFDVTLEWNPDDI
jgi:hypothetical protein